MERFPEQFSDLLTPYGVRVLKGQVQEARRWLLLGTFSIGEEVAARVGV